VFSIICVSSGQSASQSKIFVPTIFKQTRTVDAAQRQFPADYREGAEPKIDQVKTIRLRAVNDLLGDRRVIKCKSQNLI